MSRLRRVLHPSDFSRASGAAFARAVATAKADRARLLLVHVLSPPVPIAGEGYVSSKVYDDLEISARPYHDWNERITAECYAPNAASRIVDSENRIVKLFNNYAKISFNFGPTLLSWLEQHERARVVRHAAANT